MEEPWYSVEDCFGSAEIKNTLWRAKMVLDSIIQLHPSMAQFLIYKKQASLSSK